MLGEYPLVVYPCTPWFEFLDFLGVIKYVEDRGLEVRNDHSLTSGPIPVFDGNKKVASIFPIVGKGYAIENLGLMGYSPLGRRARNTLELDAARLCPI